MLKADPLIRTKLRLPLPRQGLVSRPRLQARLAEGLRGPLTLVTAPAGFGKTTLLSEFVAQLLQPPAWVSLDEGDNDPARFWSYLIAACQGVYAGVGAAAQSALQSPQPLPPETIPTLLINDLASLDRALVLILDDYHAIQDETIQAAFSFLLEHLPGNLHILISTRIDPPWPLARFRARNQMVEVRALDLRFTRQEVASFLNQAMGLELTPADVAALEKRTEGWIAGLQLAAISIQSLVSMQGRSDVPSFVQSFTGSHVYVAEYLIEEVLQRQPDDVKAFLLRTSILERLTAGLCEAVSGCGDGQEILTTLLRANLFLIPLDDQGQWFRYHRLFADLLRARLQHTFSGDEIAELHKASAGWYEQHGFALEAVNHALSAGDFDQAGRWIGEEAEGMLTRGELATLLRWTEALPEEVIWQQPAIVISKIWALTLAGAVRQVEPLLQGAEARYEADKEAPAWRELAGFAAAIRAFSAMMTGEDTRAIELAERAESLLPASSVHARWLLPYTLGAAYRGQGQYEKAVEAFERQARMGEENDNIIVWGTGVTGVLLVRRAQGRLSEVSRTCREARQRLEEQGAAEFGSLAKLETPLVEVLCEQNELDEAQERMKHVMRRLQGWPVPTDRLHAQLAQIELQMAQGDLTGAIETLGAAKDLRAAHPVLMNLSRSLDLCEIRLSLACGDIASAERLIAALEPATSRWVESRERERSLLARLRLAQGRSQEAERILTPLAKEAEAGGRKGTLIESLALKACALSLLKEREAAQEVLIQALALAEPEGFVRVFIDEGEEMRQLLLAADRQLAVEPEQDSLSTRAYLNKLLAAFPPGSAPEASPPPVRGAGLVEPLTRRELEVLQLIARGDSNRAVAEKLVITVSAVKKHAANIYGKLNVNSRTQAVARARQLGLLPDSE